MTKYFELVLTFCELIGFSIGIFNFFAKKTESALYIKIIVFGIGCAMLGDLFDTLQLFVNGTIQSGFHVGILGVVGSFLFFFTANYGQMDSLVDDGSKEMRKYRLTALAAPLLILLLFGGYFTLKGIGIDSVVRGVEAIIIAQASYFNLKHLLIPDVEGGIIRSIRSYNLLALIYAVLCMVELIFTAVQVNIIWNILLYFSMCVLMLLFVPVLKRGVAKWTT